MIARKEKTKELKLLIIVLGRNLLESINDKERNKYEGEENDNIALLTIKFTKYFRLKKYYANKKNLRKIKAAKEN